ncbi:MAG: acetolactate synthase [Nocardioidaceae bacterium]|nr:acetolactate synthase [Nocardioidaceae bacterium]
MTGGEALVAALVEHGVEVVFGIPGTHNLEIYKHLSLRGVRHVGTRHEQGAGYAADGYARTTGKVGVAVVTTGPALLNAATAIGQAYSDSIPVLVVSPGLPLRHPATGNGLLHETKDQGAAMRAVAAASLRATSVAEIPATVAQAFAIMTSGRPRPVHLEVPLDVLEETAPVALVAPLATAVPVPPVDEAVSFLDAATRPVLVVGGGARGAAVQVRALAERLGAPVVTTSNGKGILPEDHALALGAGVHLPAVVDLVAESDAVVAIGTELAPADHWYGPLPLHDKVIRVDVDPIGAVTNASPRVALVGDAAGVLDALLDRLAQHGPGHDLVAWRERKQKDARTEGAAWVRFVEELAAALPRDAIVGADNAMACYLGVHTQLPTYGPSTYLFPSGYGTLGFGLPAAIGAKIGNPDRPVVAVLGDGGVMFTVAELATAAEQGLALPVVIADNSGYGEIRNEMADRGDPVHAVTFGAPDFALLGQSLGCHGVSLDGTEGLAAAVRVALVADRPTVLHVRLPEGATA